MANLNDLGFGNSFSDMTPREKSRLTGFHPDSEEASHGIGEDT